MRTPQMEKMKMIFRALAVSTVVVTAYFPTVSWCTVQGASNAVDSGNIRSTHQVQLPHEY